MHTNLNPRMQASENIKHCGWPSCNAACCIYGAWVELPLADEILTMADQISPLLPLQNQNPGAWFSELEEEDVHVPGGRVRHTMTTPNATHYGGQACIFLREDAKCALQVLGTETKTHHWRYKPFYCILHPLMLDDHGRITLDETNEMVDEPGSCIRHSVNEVLLKDLYSEEVDYLQGRFGKNLAT